MLLKSRAIEFVGVRETLASGTLPHRHESVLVGVEDSALLAHGLRVGNGCGEESVLLYSTLTHRPAQLLCLIKNI